jgi:pimeloyl-ACP methyl ester carboxylesterase
MKMPDQSLVFIHGFRSSTGAWTKLIQLLRDDPDLGGVRIFTFGYPSSIKPQLPQSTTRIPDNSDIAQTLESYLAAKVPAGDVAVVTHSLGGLILQRFLAWMLNEGRGLELARIRLIVMLVCPNLGSEYLGLLRTATRLRHHPQARDLHPLNIDVTDAHRKVLNSIDKAEGVSPYHCEIPIYAYAGGEDNIVTRASAQSTFTNIRLLPGDHSSILDPDAQGNITFPTLKMLLRKHLLAPTETESVEAGQSSELSTGMIRARPVLETCSPLIEETLDLTLTSEGIQSVRVTEGEPNDRVLVAVPSAATMKEYHRALTESAALTVPPDDATIRRIHGLVLPVQRALLPAIPESVRRRVAAESTGQARRLVAIELRLMSSELESYPWELLSDATDVVIWRKVTSPGPPPRWTSNLLLTGTAARREVRDELAAIRSELNGYRNLDVVDCPGNPPDLSQLLRMHRPAALHLMSYPADQEGIQPQSVAADLRQYGVWTAVFNCPDSATASSSRSRPTAHEIAARSGTATIGMAGQLNPGAGQLFAIRFYRCLAEGFSVLRAYHEAVRGIRDDGTYPAMWSVPVMNASSPNVIPFPVSPEAQARLRLEQIRVHATVLDRELQRLARGNYRTAGEWKNHTAIPIVRTHCIVRYLADALASGPAADEQERRRRERVDRARREFQSVLYATEASLRRLGRAASPAERHKELADLPRRQDEHWRQLGRLDDLVAEAR